MMKTTNKFLTLALMAVAAFFASCYNDVIMCWLLDQGGRPHDPNGK